MPYVRVRRRDLEVAVDGVSAEEASILRLHVKSEFSEVEERCVRFTYDKTVEMLIDVVNCLEQIGYVVVSSMYYQDQREDNDVRDIIWLRKLATLEVSASAGLGEMLASAAINGDSVYLSDSSNGASVNNFPTSKRSNAAAVGGGSSSQDNDEITNDSEHYDELTKQMQCGFCAKLAVPPVYENDKEGIRCSECYSKRPAWYESQGFKYSQALTSQTVFLFYPCANDGCDAKMKLATKMQHVGACKLRNLKCSFCKWEGKLSEYLDHCKSTHAYLCISPNTSDKRGVKFALSKITDKKHHYIQLLDGKVFILNCSLKDDQFSFWIQCYGSAMDAQKYTSVLTLEVSDWKLEKTGAEVTSDLDKMSENRLFIGKEWLRKRNLLSEKDAVLKFKITKIMPHVDMASAIGFGFAAR